MSTWINLILIKSVLKNKQLIWNSVGTRIIHLVQAWYEIKESFELKNTCWRQWRNAKRHKHALTFGFNWTCSSAAQSASSSYSSKGSRLYCMVPEKSTGSWGMTPIRARRKLLGTLEMFIPSMIIDPAKYLWHSYHGIKRLSLIKKFIYKKNNNKNNMRLKTLFR